MNTVSTEHLKKTVFWQRVALVVFSLFLLVMCTSWAYYFSDWIENMNTSLFASNAFYKRPEIWLFLFSGMYLLIGVYLDYVLYQAGASLSRYLARAELVHLELAFRKQRHFWMGLTIAVLSVFLIFVLLMLGLGRF